jgi:hypothetical protein
VVSDVGGFIADKDSDAIKGEEEAYKHACHLMEHFAISVRPSTSDAVVKSEDMTCADAVANMCREKVAFIKNYGEHEASIAHELIEALVTDGNMKFAHWCNSLPKTCRSLYIALGKGLSEKVVDKEKGLVLLYNTFLPDLMSKSLSALSTKLDEAIQKVSGLSVSHRKQFMPVHELLGAWIDLYKHVTDDSGSGSTFLEVQPH